MHGVFRWKVKKIQNDKSWLKMFLYGSKYYKTKK